MDAEDREEVAEEEETYEGDGEGQDAKTWYPYITKAQFEKFLGRLQSRVPEEINRDYIRAIIRTPSMIYRFLRGIEAMKLIDRDQKPTERLQSLVDQDSRRRTIAEILADLYPDLLKEFQSSNDMADRDIVTFFRKETGMGNDSANKMKMFFKYLISSADFDGAAPAATGNGSADVEPTPAPAPAPAAAAPRSGDNRRGSSNQRQPQQQRSNAESSSSVSSPSSSRTLSEAQRAYLDTLKSVLKVNIDGDWDDDMIKLAFDRLERLFDRVRRG